MTQSLFLTNRDRNVAQFVLSILLLRSGQLEVLKISICGIILSNLLLMMGVGIFAGGYGRSEIHMNVSLAHTYSSLLLLILATFLIPTAYIMTTISSPAEPLSISRSVAITTLIFYTFVLLYALKTHRRIFTEDSVRSPLRKRVLTLPEKLGFLAGIDVRVLAADPEAAQDTTPQFSLPTSLVMLAILTTLVTFHTEFVSATLSAFMAAAGVSPHITGIVILPVLGNDIITVTAAAKDQMNISAAYTLGKCAQVGLAIFPLCVTIGWILDIPLTWDFDRMLVALLSMTLLLVHSVISKAKLHWLDYPIRRIGWVAPTKRIIGSMAFY